MYHASTPKSIELVLKGLHPIMGSGNSTFSKVLFAILKNLPDFGLTKAAVEDWQDRVRDDFYSARATAMGLFTLIALHHGGGFADMVHCELTLHIV